MKPLRFVLVFLLLVANPVLPQQQNSLERLLEAEVARTVAVEQSATLASSLKDKEVALRHAERRLAMVEARLEEHGKATLGDRALFEEKIAKLMEQLEVESAARLFAEGALQIARQERATRREEGHEVPAESLSEETKSVHSNITWLRR